MEGKKKIGFYDLIILTVAVLFVFVPSLSIVTVTVYSLFLLLLLVVRFISGPISINGTISVPSLALAIYVFLCFLSLLYSQAREDSFKYCIIITICVLLFMIFSKTSEWSKYYEKLLIIVSLFSSIITIVSSLNFAWLTMFRGLLTKEAFDFATRAAGRGVYSGLLGQTGTNAFVIVPLVVIALKRLMNKEKRVLSLFYLFLSGWALFLTGKRGAVLWGLCAFLIVYLLKIKKTEKNAVNRILKTLSFIFILFIVVLIAYNSIPLVRKLLNGFLESTNVDISSGRFELYREAISVIKANPLGIGANAYASVYNENVHNEFLQISAELGLMGALSFFGFYIATVVSSIKVYLSIDSQYDGQVPVFLILSIYQLFSCFTSFPVHTFGYCIQIFLILAELTAIQVRGVLCDEDCNSNI